MVFHPEKGALTLLRARSLAVWIALCFLAGVLLPNPRAAAVTAAILSAAYLGAAMWYIPVLLRRAEVEIREDRLMCRSGLLFRQEIQIELRQIFLITKRRTPLQRYLKLCTVVLRSCGPAVRISWLTGAQAEALEGIWRPRHG